ncbi:hypothetical protein ABN284_24135 [Escherichia coli]|uniref:hypothetical protein n=1 Tax=Escherichia coli TaxID=562 RepID=UPI0019152D95|nr:hypothetical protein [Escherichia coli]
MKNSNEKLVHDFYQALEGYDFLRRVRISTLRNENETFSQLNSITYIGVFFAFGDLFAPSLVGLL